MNKIKAYAFWTIIALTSLFMLFSFATIGLSILGIALVLGIIAWAVQPLLPEEWKKPGIIHTAPYHTTD